MSNKAFETEDVNLINDAGKEIVGVTEKIDKRMRNLSIVNQPNLRLSERTTTFTYAEMIELSNSLNHALILLRTLRSREQAEAEGRAP